jgi:uridine kinase
VGIPQYSFIEHARLKEPAYVGPANIIFFEGLMAFHDKRIRDLLTYKIFINCDGISLTTQTIFAFAVG